MILIFLGICLSIQILSNSQKIDNAFLSSPQEGSFVPIGNEQIFIQEMGKKQKIAFLFIHGTGSWSELWKPLMKDLSDKGHYSVAVDLDPFGYSHSTVRSYNLYDKNFQAKKLLELINKLDIEKVILVGHSFGGRATLSLALLAPEKIKQLFLINVALGFGENTNTPAKQLPIFAQIIIKNDFLRNTIASIGTMPFLTKKLVSGFVANENSITPQIEVMYQRPLSLKNKNLQVSDWLKVFLLSKDNSLLTNKDELKKLNIPVSIIWGDLDKVTPLWQGKEIQSFFINSKFSSIPNVGHIPMIEDYSSFKTLIFNSI